MNFNTSEQEDANEFMYYIMQVLRKEQMDFGM